MKSLRFVWLTIRRMVRQVFQLPQIIAMAGKQRQRQTVLNEREAERLDRICNPSKYRGK
jgi:hypothetical protein